jgi:hypothetical protein
MRDVQTTIGDYYRETARTDDLDALATRVRSCVGFIQRVNDLLAGSESPARADYSSMLACPIDTRIEIIQAFKYARNITQHLLHPVRPRASALIGGIEVGMRIYAVWQEVPNDVHRKLYPSTQALKPHYDRHLNGKEVTETFLEAARFYFTICPDIVHRDATGEWTGFPLAHQAGVLARLHPEEPADESSARTWLDRRRPGGERRVIAGSLHAKGATDASLWVHFRAEMFLLAVLRNPRSGQY